MAFSAVDSSVQAGLHSPFSSSSSSVLLVDRVVAGLLWLPVTILGPSLKLVCAACAKVDNTLPKRRASATTQCYLYLPFGMGRATRF